jgi:radical SAM/Cys-rich protein
MDAELAELVEQALRCGAFATLDLTGGAPELNPNFRKLVRAAGRIGVRVIDRCNLSVLFEPGQEDLAEFLAAEQVQVVASLPCYTAERVDQQRGRGVFDASIEGLRLLNRHGYAEPGSGRELFLVYNPVGAHLPPAQAGLERDYRARLRADFGIEFTGLYALTNLPIKRFGDWLDRSGQRESYQQLLESSFNPEAAREVMCRDLISVGPDGTLYDCDFNQMLELPVQGERPHLRDLLTDEGRQHLAQRRIVTGSHCFGCTAGQGSSCGGAVAD